MLLQEKSPVTLGHVGGEVFVAVQTMTSSIRAQLRQKKDQKRVQREDEKNRRVSTASTLNHIRLPVVNYQVASDNIEKKSQVHVVNYR